MSIPDRDSQQHSFEYNQFVELSTDVNWGCMAMRKNHKFEHEQFMEVDNEKHHRPVQIKALLESRCAMHDALCYGCVEGDSHYLICEELLRPLSSNAKRKMN